MKDASCPDALEPESRKPNVPPNVSTSSSLIDLPSTSELTYLNFSIHYSDDHNKNTYWLLKRIVTEIFSKYQRKTLLFHFIKNKK